MINHFKAEFYKLRHSKILITILGVCAAVIMVSFALGDMTFFGAGDGTESVIGFQAKCYLSSEIPTFQTVARSSLAYTAFFWIIGILFATIFFTKEYNTGTIKLSVAYGTKRTILYYTKRAERKAEERCTAEESGKRKKEKQIRGITIKNFFVK